MNNHQKPKLHLQSSRILSILFLHLPSTSLATWHTICISTFSFRSSTFFLSDRFVFEYIRLSFCRALLSLPCLFTLFKLLLSFLTDPVVSVSISAPLVITGVIHYSNTFLFSDIISSPLRIDRSFPNAAQPSSICLSISPVWLPLSMSIS